MFLSIVILMTPNYGKRFHSKHKQCRPDQTASPEANCSESAVYFCMAKFWDTLSFFVIRLKFDHKVMPSKDTDENANSFKPDQTVK